MSSAFIPIHPLEVLALQPVTQDRVKFRGLPVYVARLYAILTPWRNAKTQIHQEPQLVNSRINERDISAEILADYLIAARH